MNEYVFIVCTHGKFGEELVRSAEMIAGKMNNVVSLSLNQGIGPEEYRNQLEEVLKGLDGKTGICIVDLFGGTPFNCAAQLSQNYDMEILTGLNLAMFLEMHSQASYLSREELVACGLTTLVESGKNVLSLMKGE
jgi:Phosphotransferase system, mannose/fructose-specific component IIA